MPSSFTPRLRLEMQAAGENLNTWGAPRLNAVIARLDFAIAGWVTLALNGDYVLSASNGDDEARAALLKFTGAGDCVVTLPSVSKRYDVMNAAAGPVTLTTGAGAAASLGPGELAAVICDGAQVYKVRATEFGGARLSGVGDPLGPQDAATKAYVDAQVFASFSGALPGQAGNAGGVLRTNGTSPAWAALTTADLTNYAADQAARGAALRAFAVAAALTL